ncbi:MAG: hypothetical protein MAG453_02175 [Calditrichaeota bacterium]|nr:hypothetical protein [Calditrichota bacterium]
MNRLLIAVTALALCLTAPPSFAQDHPDRGGAPDSTHGAGAGEMMQAEAHAGGGSHREDATAQMDGDDHAAPAQSTTHELGAKLPVWSALPFLGILLSIALFPLFTPVWWHHHYPKVSAFWAIVFAVPFVISYGTPAWHEILHIYVTDYIPFIILLWGLFTASGGILLRGSLVGRPPVNLLLLLIGTILASWMGTTGAAMVMIRPVIRANKHRRYRTHVVVFFIFLVANIGGSLTPLGDPPLFLGFLHGVPFFWTFNIFPHFAMTAAMLLIVFFVIDSILYAREKKQFAIEEAKHAEVERQPLSLHGWHNIFFLMGVMGAVLFSGTAELGHIEFAGLHVAWAAIVRDLAILVMIALSLLTTPYISRKKEAVLRATRPADYEQILRRNVRHGNEFDWFPIKEVAYLFAGIFMTIVPALAMLRAGTHGHLAFIIEATREPAQFFWITGILSSFLDNAPTYLTFFNLAQGRLALNDQIVNQILTGEITHRAAGEFIPILKAISAGAVFFGAMTYIGNAPNFMVRSIAEEQKIRMPSFFGFMLWSIAILVPLLVVVTLVFF